MHHRRRAEIHRHAGARFARPVPLVARECVAGAGLGIARHCRRKLSMIA